MHGKPCLIPIFKPFLKICFTFFLTQKHCSFRDVYKIGFIMISVSVHVTFKSGKINAVLETAGRIVAKCDQTLVWATKFFPKDRPENEFGRPNLGRGCRMFSAYLRSISEINIFKTDQRTWGNNIVFLPKEAAIILTGSLRFSATCCLILFSKTTFSRTRLTL